MTDKIDELRMTLLKNKFENELEILEVENKKGKLEFITNRIEKLKEILKSFDKEDIDEDDHKTKLNNTLEKFVYKRAWSRLSDIHKYHKLKEYLLEQNITRDNVKSLLKELLNLVKENKLNSSKYIVYNQFEGKIEKIKILEMNGETMTIVLPQKQNKLKKNK